MNPSYHSMICSFVNSVFSWRKSRSALDSFFLDETQPIIVLASRRVRLISNKEHDGLRRWRCWWSCNRCRQLLHVKNKPSQRKTIVVCDVASVYISYSDDDFLSFSLVFSFFSSSLFFIRNNAKKEEERENPCRRNNMEVVADGWVNFFWRLLLNIPNLIGKYMYID